MDRIELKGIQAIGYHGVYDHEKVSGQTFIADATIWVDHTQASLSDNLNDTVDYSLICQIIYDYLTGTPVNLIETLSVYIAQKILTTFPQIYSVEITIHKPEAPVTVSFSDIAVVARLSRKELANRVRFSYECLARSSGIVLSLGSNMGNSAELLCDAIVQIPAVTNVSALYRTKAWGNIDQPDFLNCIVIAQAKIFSPTQWLRLVVRLEDQVGRVRDQHWGPRVLDIDLIAFTDYQVPPVSTPQLHIPHLYAHQRAFVLIPWLEVDPAAVLCVDGIPVKVADLVNDLTSQERQSVVRINNGWALEQENWY